MGRVKELLHECIEDGFVPASKQSVAKWRESIGKSLDGLPVSREYLGIDVDVIPVEVGRAITELLPESYDELGWLIEAFDR